MDDNLFRRYVISLAPISASIGLGLLIVFILLFLAYNMIFN